MKGKTSSNNEELQLVTHLISIEMKLNLKLLITGINTEKINLNFQIIGNPKVNQMVV